MHAPDPREAGHDQVLHSQLAQLAGKPQLFLSLSQPFEAPPPPPTMAVSPPNDLVESVAGFDNPLVVLTP